MIINEKIKTLIAKEEQRQKEEISLIASENYASKAILKITGSILTNKYAEGLPLKRYYGGCENIDQLELLAIKYGKELFHAEHLNVQPHSGSQANAAAFLAFLNPNDVILAMSLNSGGHLTHGHHLNFSGQYYQFVTYDVDKKTQLLNYENILQLALKYKPKMIIAGASSYSRFIDFKKFREIANKVNAFLLVDMAHIAGLVAAKLHPDPFLYADVITSTTHKTLRGPRGGIIFCRKKYASLIDKAVFPGTQGGPLEHVIAAKAQAFYEALQPEFKTYQNQILKNTKAMIKAFKKANFIIVSQTSDNHLFTINTFESLNISGKKATEILAKINVIVNKNVIPFDHLKPYYTSGIRIGTPLITTRGFKEKDAYYLSELMILALRNANETNLATIKLKVLKLAQEFNFYET